MTSPGRVKKLAQQFEPSRPTPGTTGAKQPSPQPLAIPGLASGGVAATRARFEGAGTSPAPGGAPTAGVVEDEGAKRKRVLSEHLIRSGRANVPGATAGRGKYKLGGARSADADERAEGGAGRVLTGMEKATQEHQRATNPGGPLAHAVSGHGKGTDQKARLLHGRRNDEMLEDESEGDTPPTSVQLGTDPHGPSTPEYTTVGTDPSNISGRFSSNQGMLHAVGEAFARADMNERSLPQGTAPERFVTGVSGRGGEDTGESFALPDTFAKQKEGAQVSPDEMRQRHAAMTTTGVANSKLVLDPVKGASGKRAGFTLQTAFPSSEAPDAAWNKPRHEGDLGDIRALTATRDEKQKEVDARGKDIEKAKKEVEKHESAIKAKNTALGKTANATAQAKIQEAIKEADQKLKEAQVKQQEAEQDETEAQEELKNAQDTLDAR